jgi:hypothetical protein
MLMSVFIRSVFNLQGVNNTPALLWIVDFKKQNKSLQYLPHKWFPLQSLTSVPTNNIETNENIKPEDGLPGEAG